MLLMDYTNFTVVHMIKVEIDKSSAVPVYRQLMQNIVRQVKDGQLKPGDKLPPERELALELDVARGTVKKAYSELENTRIIDVIQGRGSFVARAQDVVVQSRKDRAVSLIDHALDELEDLKFSRQEIQTFFHLLMMKREQRILDFNVAVIDCNMEALSVIEKQLQYISRIKIHKYLLDDLNNENDPQQRLSGFDIIITTSTHFSELTGLLPDLADRIVQAALSPSQQTIIDLASIKSENSIGIICHSNRFRDIIKSRLKTFGIPTKSIPTLRAEKEKDYHAFLKDKQVIIVPPDSSIGEGKIRAAALQDFTTRGGTVIPFNYQIDRGSLIYIEEQISERLNKK